MATFGVYLSQSTVSTSSMNSSDPNMRKLTEREVEGETWNWPTWTICSRRVLLNQQPLNGHHLECPPKEGRNDAILRRLRYPQRNNHQGQLPHLKDVYMILLILLTTCETREFLPRLNKTQTVTKLSSMIGIRTKPPLKQFTDCLDRSECHSV